MGSFMLVLFASLAFAAAAECTKKTCATVLVSYEEYDSFTHNGASSISVNGIEALSVPAPAAGAEKNFANSKWEMYDVSKPLTITANAPLTEAMVPKFMCVGWEAGVAPVTEAKGLTIVLNAKAGEKFHCTVRILKLGSNKKSGSREVAPPPKGADVSIVKGGDLTTEVGQNQELSQFTLAITNSGGGSFESSIPAENLYVVDNIDPRLEIRSVINDAVMDSFTVCTSVPPVDVNTGIWGNNITCRAPLKLLVGATWYITIQYYPPAEIALNENRTIINVASVNSTTYDPNPENNEETHTVMLVTNANLNLLLDGAPSITAGNNDTSRFTARICNAGLSKAFNVELNLTIPEELQIVGPITGPKGTCTTPDNTTVPTSTCSGFDLVLEECVTFSFNAKVLSTAAGPNGYVVTMSGHVSSLTNDSFPLDDSDDIPIRIVVQAALRITKSSAAFVYAGEQTQFNLIVTNAGPSTAYTVRVTDQIPPPFTIVSITPERGTCTPTTFPGSNFISCEIGNINSRAAGFQGTANITVVVQCPADANRTIVAISQANDRTNAVLNEAYVTSVNPSDPSEVLKDPAYINILDQDNLVVTKTCPQSPLVGGSNDVVFFQLNLWNLGPSDSRNVVIRDVIPPQFEVVGEPAVVSGPFSCSYIVDNADLVLVCTATESIVPTTATPEAPVRVRVFFRPTFSITAETNVTNTFTATSEVSIREAIDYSASCQTTLLPPPDIRIFKSGPPRILVNDPTEVFAYNVRISNNGPTDGQNVAFVDVVDSVLSVRTDLVDISGGVGPYSYADNCSANSSGNQFNCSFGTLPFGANPIVILIPFTVIEGTVAQTVPNCANVTADLNINVPPGQEQSQVQFDRTHSCWNIILEAGVQLFASKRVSPSTICAGNGGEYTIAVRNGGPADAVNVTLTDTLPPQFTSPEVTSVTLLPANTPLSLDLCVFSQANVLLCTYPQLAPGQSLQAKFTFDVPSSTITQTVNNVVVANTNTFEISREFASADIDVNVIVCVALSIDKTGTDIVVAGSSGNSSTGLDYVYNVEVTNNGPSDAINVKIVDPLPLGFRATGYGESSPQFPGLVCTFDDNDAQGRNVVMCSFPGTFAVNASYTVFIFFRVDDTVSSAASPAVNCATATTDSNSASVQDCHQTIIRNEVDLIVRKFSRSGQICAGTGNGLFDITVSNAGPSRAWDAILVDTIPSPFVLVPGSITINGASSGDAPFCEQVDATIRCLLGNLRANPPSNDILSISYRLSVPANTAAQDNVTNTAVASSGCAAGVQPCVRDSSETNLPTNTDTASTNVCAYADISIVKSANAESYVAGESTNNFFTLAVTNNGPAWAYDVVVKDYNFEAPGLNITGLALSGATGTCTTSAPWQCTIFQLPSGIGANSASVTVFFSVASDTLCGFRPNYANVTSPTTDLVEGNNVDDITVLIRQEHDIVVNKTGIMMATAGGMQGWFEIEVTQEGPSFATDVVFTDDVPEPLIIVGVSVEVVSNPSGNPVNPDNCTWNNAQQLITCNFGDMYVGSVYVVRYNFTVPSDADLPDNGQVINTGCAYATYPEVGACESEINPANNCDSYTTTLICDANVAIFKTDDVTEIIAGTGEIFTYNIYLSNVGGPSTARDLVVTDFVPSVYTRIGNPSVVQPGFTGACGWTSDGVFCNIGDLKADQSINITYSYQVLADVANGNYTNIVNVQGTCADSSARWTDTNEVFNRADLSIIKDDCVDTVVAGGDSQRFTFTVSNAGPSTAKGVVVTDTIPAVYIVEGLPELAGVLPDNDACDVEFLIDGATRITCTYSTFEAGTQALIYVKYHVDSDTPEGSVTNCAYVSSATSDPESRDDYDCDTNKVITEADLEITKTLSTEDCIVAGSPDVATYLVTVLNKGPSTARNVVIDEHFPAGADIQSYPSICAPQGDNHFVCTLESPSFILAGAHVTLTFTFTVSSSTMEGIITNVATVTSSTFDPELCNNNVTLCSAVCVESDLWVTKDDGVTEVTAGEVDLEGNYIKYTFNITGYNAGPSDAKNVVFTDMWPINDPGYVRLEVTGATCVPSGNNLVCNVGSLAVDESASFCISYYVDPCALDCIICNVVGITSDSVDKNHDNDLAKDCNKVRTEADLEVCKTDNVDMVVAGKDTVYTYTAIVTNNGPSCAQKVTLVDHFPSTVNQIAFWIPTIPGAPSQGSCVQAPIPGHELDFSCNLLTLSPGESVTVYASYTVPANTTTCSITNVVTVHSITFDPKQCNNDYKDTNALVEEAVLHITKTSSTGSEIVAGDYGNHTYTVCVWNEGPSEASDAVITDQWPNNAGVVQYTQTITLSNGRPAVSTGGDITAAIGKLAVGEENRVCMYVPFSLMDGMPAGSAIVNRASVFSPTDSECRNTEHTIVVIPSINKKRSNVKNALPFALPRNTAPASRDAPVVIVDKPTDAPRKHTAANPTLSVWRAGVKLTKSANVYEVQVTNTNVKGIRMIKAALRIPGANGRFESIDVTQVSDAVKATTCATLASSKMAKGWTVKCQFELTETVADSAVLTVSGLGRAPDGIHAVVGTSM